MHTFSPGAALAGLLAIALGTLGMLDAADVTAVEPGLVWPGAIVILGLALVAHAITRHAEGD